MFLAIDRFSRLIYVDFYDSPGKSEGSAFHRRIVKTFLYRLCRVLTDNGVAFIRNASTEYDTMQHPFDRVCDENVIEHRLTKLCHYWTNGQAERMNRTVEDVAMKTRDYDNAELLRAHGLTFIAACSFATHLKALT